MVPHYRAVVGMPIRLGAPVRLIGALVLGPRWLGGGLCKQHLHPGEDVTCVCCGAGPADRTTGPPGGIADFPRQPPSTGCRGQERRTHLHAGVLISGGYARTPLQGYAASTGCWC